MLVKYSIFVVLFIITTVQCDVSHLKLDSSNVVDERTIEVLQKNITEYLVHLNGPQMHLMQIYGVTKQAVTGTIYTVQALLETPEGAKNCEIRVLEKPWLDFCQVHVLCENGGEYEYTFNPNQPEQHPPTQIPKISPPQQEKPHGIPRVVLSPPPLLDVAIQEPQESVAFNTYLNGLFDEFMTKYERQYINIPGEREYRFSVFKDNYMKMYEHIITDPVATYSVTEFSDLTNDEFSRITGFIPNEENYENLTTSNETMPGDIPDEYDERDKNLVTRVRYQGSCGSCWAMTTIAAIEGLCARRTKKLQEFSEQSLIDCDPKNSGCKNGYSPSAINHILKRGGLELEANYPYVFAETKCKFNPENVRVKVAENIKFKRNDENYMKKWLFQNGPIIVSINSEPLKYYKGGILSSKSSMCNPTKVDHNVILIGYGVDVDKKTGEKLPYWIAKNSWGTRAGEKGFVRIARNKNICGLALWASSARLSDIPNNCLLPNGK